MDEEDKDKLIAAVKDMIENNLTVRQASEKYEIPRATLHKRIHKQLEFIDKNLYTNIVAKLGERNRRTG